jgi:hypothetical protein
MSTEVGRQMAERVNRSLDDSEVRVHRVGQVLADYETFALPLQQQLTAAAIVWTCASLAAHRAMNQCEAYFYTVIDIMYAQSEMGRALYDDGARQRIVVAAESDQASLVPAMQDISRSAVETISGYTADNIFRKTGEMLITLTRGYVDHIPHRLFTRDLIARCVCLAVTTDEVALGLKGKTDLLNDVAQLAESGHAIMDMVHALVRDGKLAVNNGAIVPVACSQGDDVRKS